MKPVNLILVPTDFSEAAINAMTYALWLADHLEARIKVLHIVFPGTGELDVPVISASETQKRVETAEEALDAYILASQNLLSKGYTLRHPPTVDSEVRIGAPVTELNSAARATKADMIVVGTRAKHTTVDQIFGSVATGVVLRARVPVIVVPQNAHHLRLNACCYATPLDESDPFFIWRTRQLFNPFNPMIHVAHVDPPNRSMGDITMEELEAMMSRRLSQGSVAFQALEGSDVVEELHAFAEAKELDMIVMRTTHRNLLQRLLHESVTRKMSLHSQIPVCILKGDSE